MTQDVPLTEGLAVTAGKSAGLAIDAEAGMWLQSSTYQIATKSLATGGLGRVLHMHSLRRERQTAGYCLGDLLLRALGLDSAE